MISPMNLTILKEIRKQFSFWSLLFSKIYFQINKFSWFLSFHWGLYEMTYSNLLTNSLSVLKVWNFARIHCSNLPLFFRDRPQSLISFGFDKVYYPFVVFYLYTNVFIFFSPRKQCALYGDCNEPVTTGFVHYHWGKTRRKNEHFSESNVHFLCFSFKD